MATAMYGVICLLGGFVGLGLLIGWLTWGRKRDLSRGATSLNHHWWLVQQLDREPLRSVLTDDQRQQLRELYGQGARPATIASTVAEAGKPAAPPLLEVGGDDGPIPYLSDAPVAHERPASPLAAPSVQRPPSRPGRDPLDPAALLLYAGAFLVAAAGVVYSAYNWADLAAWQKLGMLATLTIVFGGLGWFLLGNKRLREAGETFVAIAAMLVPANAIAAWTISTQTEASTGTIILAGAAISALVHGIFAIRPGGTPYAYAAPSFAWLALGAIPAAVGIPWEWGGPLVILAVGLARWLEPRFPDALLHLRHPIRKTGLIALVVAFLATSASFGDNPSWLSLVTFASLTFTLSVFAFHGTSSISGTLATIAGLLTFSSVLSLVDGDREWIDRPWVAAPVLVVVSIVLVGLGERGPAWLRRWGTRLALHIEAVVMLVGAAAAAGGERWQLVAVAVVAIAITGAIAWLRSDRWVLLLTGGAILSAGLALADAIDRIDDWPTTGILALLTMLAGILTGCGWFLDRWSERQDRPAWGLPLWIVGGLTGVWANAVVLTVDDLEPGQAIWVWLAGANLIFAVLSFVAARSTSTAVIRIVAGAWLVATAACVVTWPDLLLADRLPVALLALGALVGAGLLVSRRLDRSSEGESGAGLDLALPGLASLVVLVSMVVLATTWIVDPRVETLGAVASARWTWVSYAVVVGLIGLVAGWLSLQPVAGRSVARLVSGRLVGRIATGISAGLLLLTALLVTRMVTARDAALVVTLLLVAWALFSLAATLGPRLSSPRPGEAWRMAALVIAGLAAPCALAVPEGGNDLARRSWLTIALVSLAGMLAVEGWIRRHRLILTSASAVAMAALLIQIEAREPDNILAYSLPLGVYLLVLGAVNRRTGNLRDVLMGVGSGVLLVPVLWLAQQDGAVGYLALAAGIALALFLGGIVLRLRVPIAAGLLGLTVIVLRLVVDAVLALESWVALLVVGLLLLGAGTAALVWKEQLRERLERLQRGWHEMG